MSASITIDKENCCLILKNKKEKFIVPIITYNNFRTFFIHFNQLAKALGYDDPAKAYDVIVDFFKEDIKSHEDLKINYPIIDETAMYILIARSDKPFAKLLLLDYITNMKSITNNCS